MDEAIRNGCVWNWEMPPRHAILLGIRNIYSNTWVSCGWNLHEFTRCQNWFKGKLTGYPRKSLQNKGEFKPSLSVAFPSINRWNMVSLSESLLAQLWSAWTDSTTININVTFTRQYVHVWDWIWNDYTKLPVSLIWFIRRVYPFLGWWWMVYYWLYDIWTLKMLFHLDNKSNITTFHTK